VTTIIRAGTCGSYVPTLREGGLIVATAAVRCDGVTDRLVPPEFPAVADVQVVQALQETVKEHTDVVVWKSGIIVSMGHFYDGPLENKSRMWANAHCLGIEMEVSGLFVIASIRGIRAGALLNVDNYIFDRELSGAYQPTRAVVLQGTTRMLAVALDASARLSSDDVVAAPAISQ